MKIKTRNYNYKHKLILNINIIHKQVNHLNHAYNRLFICKILFYFIIEYIEYRSYYTYI